MKAIQIEAFGKPVEVVKVVEIIINRFWARAAFSH
jgi:hypothetical protein